MSEVKATRLRCPSCELARINGIVCHETGCPDAWRTAVRSCDWCGTEFAPADANQRFCDDSCYASYFGLEDSSDAAN
jgi:hypothetical protein